MLLLTRVKSKDITYTSGINEGVTMDFEAQSCAVSLSMGWLPGHGRLGLNSLQAMASPRGAAPKGLAWGRQSWVLVTGTSTTSGMAKNESGNAGAAVP